LNKKRHASVEAINSAVVFLVVNFRMITI